MGTNTTQNINKPLLAKELSRIKKTENCIIVDWLSATTRQWEPIQLVEYLRLDVSSFRQTYGLDGYADRLFFGGIAIDYHLRSNDPEQTNVRLVMSGQGCRQFETSSDFGFNQLFCDIQNGDFMIKRLDISYDDVDQESEGVLNLPKIARYTLHQRFVTKWGGGQVIDSFKISGNEEPMVHALTVQFGSKKSEIMLRIYDKAQERGGLDCHWVRAELVLKHDRAAGFISELLSGKSIGELYAGVLRNYLRFIRFDRSRRERCSVVGWWERFLDGAEAVKIYSAKTVEYNLARVREYVINQAGNSICTYIACVGEEKFMEDLSNRKSQLTENQRRVIEDWKNQK